MFEKRRQLELALKNAQTDLSYTLLTNEQLKETIKTNSAELKDLTLFLTEQNYSCCNRIACKYLYYTPQLTCFQAICNKLYVPLKAIRGYIVLKDKRCPLFPDSKVS